MEVVIIEKKAFESLLSHIQDLSAGIDKLCDKNEGQAMNVWLDSEDACRRMRISPRKLQRLRDAHLIGCSQVNRKFYYREDDIRRFMEECKSTDSGNVPCTRQTGETHPKWSTRPI